MGTFQKVTALKTQTIGSITSDTGSEYLFGFEPQEGLLWLERKGVEYTAVDKAWREAEKLIRQTLSGTAVPEQGQAVAPVATGGHTGEDALRSFEEEGPGVPLSGKSGTVSRTVATDFGMGSAAPDPAQNQHIVGSRGRGEEFADDDIAANAAQMFYELEG